jgi:D-alanyl-D-alanine carboxypeptidase
MTFRSFFLVTLLLSVPAFLYLHSGTAAEVDVAATITETITESTAGSTVETTVENTVESSTEPASGPPPAPDLPGCSYEDIPTKHHSVKDWRITLVDPLYALPKEYAPADLVPVAQAGLSGRGEVRAVLLDDLRMLVKAASEAGHTLVSVSAYRSYDYQVGTFNTWVNQLGRERALEVSARPGHSEHQLGTAIDFGTAGAPAPWDLADWAETPEGGWLEQHAHRYGFVMSYPRGTQEATCYDYEPWHYRYVGREAAAEVHARGITLRDWLWEQQ